MSDELEIRHDANAQSLFNGFPDALAAADLEDRLRLKTAPRKGALQRAACG